MATTAKNKTSKKATAKKFVSPWKDVKEGDCRSSSINLSCITENGKHRNFNVCTIHWQQGIDDKTAVELGELMSDVAVKYFSKKAKK